MAYSDGLQLLGMEVTTVQAETGAATIKDYPMAVPCSIEQFGVYITEDFIAQAQDWVLKLQKLDKVGGTVTDLATLTVGSSNTLLYRGDGTKAGVTLITADTDIDNGHIVYSKESLYPIQIATGEIIRLAVATAATGAGGAGQMFALVRMNGLNPASTKVWIEKEV